MRLRPTPASVFYGYLAINHLKKGGDFFIMYGFKKSLIAFASLALLGAFTALLPIVSQGQGKPQFGPRKFYLTQTSHSGDQALSACAEGYHMASHWEIFDTSNLRYDTELGFTTEDSGFGPPIVSGWIRTGFVANASPQPGQGNCLAWTSNSFSDNGTVVSLPFVWGSTSLVTSVSPWVAGTDQCFLPNRVWCVQD